MKPHELLDFMHRIEKLKSEERHSWTAAGRRESVSEHSWMLATMALLLEKDFPALDMNKVLKMCLIHDWGEAITGDIPAFEKTKADAIQEEKEIFALVQKLPGPLAAEYTALFTEMLALETAESKLCKALDKLEALFQHNEASLETWLPLEHESNLVYGDTEANWFAYTKELKEIIRKNSLKKLGKEDAP